MTVRELREILKDLDDNVEVTISHVDCENAYRVCEANLSPDGSMITLEDEDGLSYPDVCRQAENAFVTITEQLDAIDELLAAERLWANGNGTKIRKVM